MIYQLNSQVGGSSGDDEPTPEDMESHSVTLSSASLTETVLAYSLFSRRAQAKGLVFQMVPSEAATQGSLLVEVRLTDQADFVPARIEAEDSEVVDLTQPSRLYTIPFLPYEVKFTLQNPQAGLSLDLTMVYLW